MTVCCSLILSGRKVNCFLFYHDRFAVVEQLQILDPRAIIGDFHENLSFPLICGWNDCNLDCWRRRFLKSSVHTLEFIPAAVLKYFWQQIGSEELIKELVGRIGLHAIYEMDKLPSIL